MVGNRGKCLHIPVAEGMDSLNVVSALTLILYELRRRLRLPVSHEEMGFDHNNVTIVQ